MWHLAWNPIPFKVPGFCVACQGEPHNSWVWGQCSFHFPHAEMTAGMCFDLSQRSTSTLKWHTLNGHTSCRLDTLPLCSSQLYFFWAQVGSSPPWWTGGTRTHVCNMTCIHSLYLTCLISILVCLIPRPVCLIPRPVCLIPRPVCLVPRPVCLIPRPVCLILRPVCLIPRPVCPIPRPVCLTNKCSTGMDMETGHDPCWDGLGMSPGACLL